ncbi:MAG: hypothetical protein JWN68_742 [Nocardioides sp.]|jgi:hypothetical protein|uniref:hypothetical protein n=1 Tax=Nocardioides sp. TaxID=35761 RepID=UPI0026216DF7|nr:hypothetical protein [Nocardioides sp.]MCW2832789.1 hypothetical protein [Nocardioides sp.]
MTDFETRLRDSLAERAEEAPAPSGLARGARARLQRRRAAVAKGAAGVAVGTLVIAAVPVGSALVEGVDAPSRPRPVAPDTPFIVPDLSPDIQTARETKREIEWAGIRFAVPPDWKGGATTAWCARARKPGAVVPRIDLPDQARPKTSCTPTNGYGVRVTSAAGFEPERNSSEVWQYDDPGTGAPADYPDGAWVSYWFDDDWVVTTATSDPGLTSKITRSVRGLDADVNGCAPFLDDPDVLEEVGAAAVGGSRCRYAWDGDLEDSARLTEDAVARVMDALAAAPGTIGDDGCEQEQGWVVTLTPAGERPYLVRYGTLGLGSCEDGVEHLTSEGGPRDHLELTTELAEALALNPDDLSLN